MIDTSNIPFPLKSVIEPEPDWEFLDYMYELESRWKEQLCEALPKTEAEWLEIFPDAKGLLHEKIREWEAEASNARARAQTAWPNTKAQCVPQDIWFWRAVFKCTSPDIRSLAMANRRIKKLKWLLPTKTTEKAGWQTVLANARQREILPVAGQYGLRLKKIGKNYIALCPQHSERTPSFYLYPPFRFVCFGCGVKGDVIAFVQMIDKCTFKEAVYKLQKI